MSYKILPPNQIEFRQLKEIGEIIDQIVKSYDYTIADISYYCKVDKNTVNRIISGNTSHSNSLGLILAFLNSRLVFLPSDLSVPSQYNWNPDTFFNNGWVFYKRRTELALSVQQVATESKISMVSFYRIESCQPGRTLNFLRIAEVLHLTPIIEEKENGFTHITPGSHV